MINPKEKEKILKILNKLKEKGILKDYCLDVWGSGFLIEKNKVNEYIMKKFNEIGIEAEPIRSCNTQRGPCENYYLTKKDEENREWCSSYECTYNDICIYVPQKTKKEIIDEIFEKEVI